MSTDDEDPPDPPMTPEEAAIAASLSEDFVARIDAVLLSWVTTYNRKVARVVGSAMSDRSIRVPGLPDLYYAQRVRSLVERGLIIAEGNLDYMRYSEVRLPDRHDS